MFGLLWTAAVFLLIFWGLGLAFHIAGGFIHALFLMAIAIIVYNFAMGRDARQ